MTASMAPSTNRTRLINQNGLLSSEICLSEGRHTLEVLFDGAFAEGRHVKLIVDEDAILGILERQDGLLEVERHGRRGPEQLLELQRRRKDAAQVGRWSTKRRREELASRLAFRRARMLISAQRREGALSTRRPA